MAINPIQQANVMQIQQVHQASQANPARQPDHEGHHSQLDGSGNTASQVAAEVPTVARPAETNAHGRNARDEEQGKNSQTQASFTQSLEVSQEVNEKNNERIRKAVSEMNKKMRSNTEAVYGYHEDTNRVTIKIIDKESKKTVKEFPAEETLDMIAKTWELAGLMVGERK